MGAKLTLGGYLPCFAYQGYQRTKPDERTRLAQQETDFANPCGYETPADNLTWDTTD